MASDRLITPRAVGTHFPHEARTRAVQTFPLIITHGLPRITPTLPPRSYPCSRGSWIKKVFLTKFQLTARGDRISYLPELDLLLDFFSTIKNTQQYHFYQPFIRTPSKNLKSFSVLSAGCWLVVAWPGAPVKPVLSMMGNRTSPVAVCFFPFSRFKSSPQKRKKGPTSRLPFSAYWGFRTCFEVRTKYVHEYNCRDLLMVEFLPVFFPQTVDKRKLQMWPGIFPFSWNCSQLGLFSINLWE